MSEMLSQEEIDALMGNAGPVATPESSPAMSGETLTDAERDAVGEIANINMGTAATTLSTLLNTKVTITTPKVSYVTLDDLSAQYDRPCVFIRISYIDGIDGNNILILKENDVKIITDLMMGGDGSNIEGELSELHLSAISEAMNQMMGSAATSLSSMLEKKVDISPPTSSVVDLNDAVSDDEISSFLSERIVQVSFEMKIGDLIDSQIMQLYPFAFARDLYKRFVGETDALNTVSEPEPEPQQEQPSQMPAPDAPAMEAQTQNFANMDSGAMQNQQMMQGQMPGAMPMQGMPMQGMPMQGMPMQGMPVDPAMMQSYMMSMQNVNVQPAQFQPFNAAVSPLMQEENIGLIMDVPLEVTVELGRANKSIREILDFSPGTIIELNKIAGEPVDIMVNGKYVAKGEVVVIEENFGIRIVEISK